MQHRKKHTKKSGKKIRGGAFEYENPTTIVNEQKQGHTHPTNRALVKIPRKYNITSLSSRARILSPPVNRRSKTEVIKAYNDRESHLKQAYDNSIQQAHRNKQKEMYNKYKHNNEETINLTNATIPDNNKVKKIEEKLKVRSLAKQYGIDLNQAFTPRELNVIGDYISNKGSPNTVFGFHGKTYVPYKGIVGDVSKMLNEHGNINLGIALNKYKYAKNYKQNLQNTLRIASALKHTPNDIGLRELINSIDEYGFSDRKRRILDNILAGYRHAANQKFKLQPTESTV